MGETVNETVKIILALSVSGGLFALVLFALKPLIRNKLSKSFQYYIWLVVLLRFILPFSFGINLVDSIFDVPNAPQTVEETLIPNNNSAMNDNPANNNNPSITEQQPTTPLSPNNAKPFDLPQAIAANLLWIWLIGAVISMAFNILGYLRFIQYIRGVAYAVEIPNCKTRVYKSRFVPTPMLVGVIRQRIYLPDTPYTDEQQNNILLHEVTHLRRHDAWLKWFATLVVSVHWFNPVVYFIRREFNRACELSCDEAVIRNLDSTAKQSYGDTLISVVAESRYPVGVMSVTMCEEKKKLKERLVAIMNYKKKTKLAVLITAVLAVVLTCSAFAFGAQSGNFPWGKTDGISVTFPYEYLSDASGEMVAALICDAVNRSDAPIYLSTNSYNIHLNPDFKLKNMTADVLIPETDKNGSTVYRKYQIRFLGADHIMNIFPYNDDRYLLPSDTEFRRGPFENYWNALASIPVDTLVATVTRPSPDFYSLHVSFDAYPPDPSFERQIIYNRNGVLEAYQPDPAFMITFTPMYEEFGRRGEGDNYEQVRSGVGTVELYYCDVFDESPVAINGIIPDNAVLSIYIADGGLSQVVLLENNRFSVVGRPEINYIPTGGYEIDGNKLYLNVSENQQFIFSIYENSLIFESGEWLENWIAKETVFTLLGDGQ